MRACVRDWVKTIVTAVVLALIVIQFVMPTKVYGRSMMPTLEPGDMLIVNKCAYVNGITPSKGDVVVFQSHLLDSNGDNKDLIKRVIAVEGDTVMVKDGKVYINGEEMEENYIKDGYTSGDVDLVTVPKNSLFCMGDNRLNSTDSRHMEVGFIRTKDVVGKAMVRFFPLSKASRIED